MTYNGFDLSGKSAIVTGAGTNRIPLHRMGQPEQMVEAATYLPSDASSFVNGSVLMVDGGFTAS